MATDSLLKFSFPCCLLQFLALQVSGDVDICSNKTAQGSSLKLTRSKHSMYYHEKKHCNCNVSTKERVNIKARFDIPRTSTYCQERLVIKGMGYRPIIYEFCSKSDGSQTSGYSSFLVPQMVTSVYYSWEENSDPRVTGYLDLEVTSKTQSNITVRCNLPEMHVTSTSGEITSDSPSSHSVPSSSSSKTDLMKPTHNPTSLGSVVGAEVTSSADNNMDDSFIVSTALLSAALIAVLLGFLIYVFYRKFFTSQNTNTGNVGGEGPAPIYEEVEMNLLNEELEQNQLTPVTSQLVETDYMEPVNPYRNM